MKTEAHAKEDALGQNKEYEIFVNTRPHNWPQKEISFDQVVVLAYGSVSTDPNVIYTITFKRGHGEKPEGVMVKGDVIKVKDGMKFNVTQANKS